MPGTNSPGVAGRAKPKLPASESRFRNFPAIDGRRRMPAAARLANRFPGPRRVRLHANRDDRSPFADSDKDRNDGRHRHHAPGSSRQARPRRCSRDSAGAIRSREQPLIREIPVLQRSRVIENAVARQEEERHRQRRPARRREALGPSAGRRAPDRMTANRRIGVRTGAMGELVGQAGSATPCPMATPLPGRADGRGILTIGTMPFDARIPARFRFFMTRRARRAGGANSRAGMVSRAVGWAAPGESSMRRRAFATKLVPPWRSRPRSEPREWGETPAIQAVGFFWNECEFWY